MSAPYRMDPTVVAWCVIIAVVALVALVVRLHRDAERRRVLERWMAMVASSAEPVHVRVLGPTSSVCVAYDWQHDRDAGLRCEVPVEEFVAA